MTHGLVSDEELQAGHRHQLAVLFKDKMCPGLMERVPHPIEPTWRPRVLVWTVVFELNDEFKWTYDQIADWLETLDVDLTVRPLSSGYGKPTTLD